MDSSILNKMINRIPLLVMGVIFLRKMLLIGTCITSELAGSGVPTPSSKSRRSRKLISATFQQAATVRLGRLCRLLDYVDLMFCAHPKTLAGAEDVNARGYIIRNPSRVGNCWRYEIHVIVIAAISDPMRFHRESTTDFVVTGSCLAPEIMSTSQKPISSWKSLGAWLPW